MNAILFEPFRVLSGQRVHIHQRIAPLCCHLPGDLCDLIHNQRLNIVVGNAFCLTLQEERRRQCAENDLRIAISIQQTQQIFFEGIRALPVLGL